jgi:hypothetical protein
MVLIDETRQMEERLAALRIAMSEEKNKWQNVPRRKKDGVIWRGARYIHSSHLLVIAMVASQ